MPRHELNPVSLMFGVLFAGLGALSLLQAGPGLSAKWAAPVLLIGVGVVGLIAAGRDSRSDRAARARGRNEPPSA